MKNEPAMHDIRTDPSPLHDESEHALRSAYLIAIAKLQVDEKLSWCAALAIGCGVYYKFDTVVGSMVAVVVVLFFSKLHYGRAYAATEADYEKRLKQPGTSE